MLLTIDDKDLSRLSQHLSILSQQWRSNIQDLTLLRERAQTLEEFYTMMNEADDRTSLLRDLQRENKMVTDLVQEYQTALDEIMSKFRLQSELVHEEKKQLRKELEAELEQERRRNESLAQENALLSSYLEKSIDTMRKALAAEDSSETLKAVYGLSEENRTLRQLIMIHSKNSNSTGDKKSVQKQ